MTVDTKKVILKRTVRLAREGSFNSGAGKADRLPIGILASDGRRQRAAMRPADNDIPASFYTEMGELLKVELWGYKVDYFRVDAGASPQSRARAATAGWSEGTSSDLSSGNATIFGDPPTHAGSECRGGVVGSGQGWRKIAEVTPIAKRWAPADLGGQGLQCFGVVVAQDGDDWSASPGYTGTANNAEYASDDWGDGSKAPYLLYTFDRNRAPLPALVQSPEPSSPGGAATQVASLTGTEATIELLFVDPGDSCSLVEVEVYYDGATDAVPSPLYRKYGPVAPRVLNAAEQRYSVTLTGLPARTTLRHRVRPYDSEGKVAKGGEYGGWTSLAEGRIVTAYMPDVPVNPTMQSTPASPHIGGSLKSADPSDYLTGWEGTVRRANPDGTFTTLWSTRVDIGGGTVGPPPSPTRSDVTYGGDTLNAGDTVQWQHRHVNRDGVAGAWSPWYTKGIVAQVGPSISPADTSTKNLSRTPQLTITFEQSSDGYQVRLYRGGVLISDTGIVTIGAAGSVSWSIPAGVANWGDTLEVEAASRPVGGSLGPFSPRSGLYIDTLPTTTLSASV